MKKEKITIFDTTLRDGQQSPGAGMTFKENIAYAKLASDLGVDILEAGFPAASEYDFEITQAISRWIADHPVDMAVAGLCQLREAQIIRTMEALQPSLKKQLSVLHTYVAVDPNLMQASLGQLAKDEKQIIADVQRFIEMAVKEGFTVEFSLEGYSRMGHYFDFATDVIRAAVGSGAAIINCPDTIGGACRYQEKDYFVDKMQQHADIIQKEFPDKAVVWSVHCHNDYGLALDNTLTGIFEGPARQIEGCINGIGERAGNVALEQCILCIASFGQSAKPGHHFYTDIRLSRVKKISDFVAEKMLMRQPHWPIVGENFARHTSGGHTNAILNNPLAYQPFDPAVVGGEISFLFGPLSGSNHLKQVVESHGYACKAAERVEVAQYVKSYFKNRRKGITDTELMAAYFSYRNPIKIENIAHKKDKQIELTVTVLGIDEKVMISCLQGQPDLASLKACLVLPMNDYALDQVDVQPLTVAASSPVQATVQLVTKHKKKQRGYCEGENPDVVVIRAFIDAVNKLYIHQHYGLK